MAISYQIKVRAVNSSNNYRTLIFQPAQISIDNEEELNNFAQKLQPLILDTIQSVECYRIRSVNNYQSTVPAGVDGLPDSTQDSTIFLLQNDLNSKRITINRSASAAESDTAAFEAYATAVYEFGNVLTSNLEGDYSVGDVTLRAVYDYEVEQP